MSNILALVLGLLILGAIAVDIVMFSSEHIVFLGKKLSAFIEWMAFWR